MTEQNKMRCVLIVTKSETVTMSKEKVIDFLNSHCYVC